MAKKGPTKRDLQREETRRKIHDTAMDLFNKKGFTRVSVEEICEKVGVSKGTFYYYFKSKNQVLVEEFLKVDDFYLEAIDRLDREYDSPTVKLIELTRESHQFQCDNVGLKLLKVIYHSEIDPMIGSKAQLPKPGRPIYGILKRLVEEGQERGELRSDVTADSIVLLWVRYYRGVTYDWCLQNGRFDLVEAGMEIASLTIDGLRKR